MQEHRMDVRQVAALAKLALTPEEEVRMAAEMDAILAFAQMLRQQDADTAPATQVIPLENVLREDEAEPSLPSEALLAGAPVRTADCVAVPRAVE